MVSLKHLIFEAKKYQNRRASRSRNSWIVEEAKIPVRRTGATTSDERLSGSVFASNIQYLVKD